MNRPNVLLITADDLNWDSVGAYGCATPACTPNLDRLAAEGVRFTHAHVTIAVCQPSRGVLMTGRYPHRSGQEGFHLIHGSGVPLVPELLRNAGYLVGILGKVGHSTPRGDFCWDFHEDMPQLGWGRDAARYHALTRRLLDTAARSSRPFFLMANAHDPHRPFHGNDADLQGRDGISFPAPSRVYRPEEVRVPGFLPDLPEVRRELAEYAGSVRRCDDVVGAVMNALETAGVCDRTLVMFLSDNGMAFPFAKANCYLHSTRTPWIARWPGRIAPGTADSRHFISGIDFLPTVMEAVGLPGVDGVDGRSFLRVLEGGQDLLRNRVFTQFHETYARRRYPMRCVQDRRFGYIFNAWSDGRCEYRNESQSGRTFRAMQTAAAHDATVAERVRLFQFREVEELYDFERDPAATVNLAGDPQHAPERERLRDELDAWMVATEDPALTAFRSRSSPEARLAFMHAQVARSQTAHSIQDPEPRA